LYVPCVVALPGMIVLSSETKIQFGFGMISRSPLRPGK
jgi:hypothetical protein